VALAERGPWDLPIRGFVVLHVTFAFRLDIVAYGDEGATATIILAGRFEFTHDGQRVSLDAAGQPWEALTPVLGLRHDPVSSAQASEDGQLIVDFESGSRIEAGPDEMYENWDVSGPGFRLIAMPGGDVAVWDRDT
jgi:Family of unknown function (DUF6188)